MNLIERNKQNIYKLCKIYKVDKLFVFGSILTDSFSIKSDIDMVVDFSEVDMLDYADNYFDFKDSLENLFSRKVDLLKKKRFVILFCEAQLIQLNN